MTAESGRHGRKPSLDEFGEQLHAFLEHVQRETNVPGIAAAVSLEGARVFASAGTLALDSVDPLTRHTRFHLGCITKLYVSIVILELVRSGSLDLDAALEAYLPELAGCTHGKCVTLAHLLSHTSGYRGSSIHEPGTLQMDWHDLVEWLRSTPRHFEPGTVFSYEHTETVIAAEVVRRVTGRSALAHVRARLFEPLGLTGDALAGTGPGAAAGQHVLDPATRRFKQVHWADLAASAGPPPAIWEAAFSPDSMSLDALLATAELIIGQSRPRTDLEAALAPATLNLLQRPAVAVPRLTSGPLAETAPAAFGLGAGRWRDGFYGIGGSTYGQCQGFRFDAHLGAAVAVGVNVLQPYLRDLVIGRICEALAAPDGDGMAECDLEVDLAALSGDYRGPGTSRVLASFADDRLELVFESAATPLRLRAEVSRGTDGGLRLSCVSPQLSIGFFWEPDGCNVGLMVGVHAYKRVPPCPARGERADEPASNGETRK